VTSASSFEASLEEFSGEVAAGRLRFRVGRLENLTREECDCACVVVVEGARGRANVGISMQICDQHAFREHAEILAY
jgi:hypothetical protein